MENIYLIDRLLHEHEAIRAQAKLVNRLANRWTTGEFNDLLESDQTAFPSFARQKMSLQHAISYLDEGLKQQYSYEDEVLPALIGNPLMDAILIERQTMMGRLEEINFLLLHITPEGLAAIWNDLQKVITHFSHWLIDHNLLEDVMLNHLKTNLPHETPVLASST